MGDHAFEGLGINGDQLDGKIVQTFQKSFVQVQSLLDQNRLLINEINQNHESRVPDNLSKNVGLIRELNNNIKRVVHLYGDLSTSFIKSMDASSEGDSSGASKSRGKAAHKRHRPG
ncbi:ELF4-like protein [Striga asiatica]|uniref:ELF4-like protein n=1 Tax=Striga asiatica TaxID=4170 RepID=A0A5A7PTW7_STRAF|nr:ELF4-like protein [Striga asiatica]